MASVVQKLKLANLANGGCGVDSIFFVTAKIVLTSRFTGLIHIRGEYTSASSTAARMFGIYRPIFIFIHGVKQILTRLRGH